MSSVRRLPLWTMLIPLVAGVGLWFWLWSGYRNDLAATLRPLLPADTLIETGGFPYRLEARVAPLGFAYAGEALEASLKASQAVVHRVPWQTHHAVLNLEQPDLRLALSAVPGATLRIAAPAAQASLKRADGRIARLSLVWHNPRIETGLLAPAMTAESLEAHLRETPAEQLPASSPRHPTQDQLMLSARALRIGGGDPLDLAMTAEVTAPHPVTSLNGWRDGGTVEGRTLTLSDATGEVARFTGTLVMDAGGALSLAGTVETVCPASVRAAFANAPAPSEMRSRKPVRIAFAGTLPAGLAMAPAVPGSMVPPVRAQEPPCPRLR